MLGNTPNQPSKFRSENCVEINYDAHGTYDINSQIKFKTTMLKSSLCNHSDVHMLAKGILTVADTLAAAAATNNGNKRVIFNNCDPFKDCISKINKQYTNT